MARGNIFGNMLRIVSICLIVGTILGVYPVMANGHAEFAPQSPGGSISGVVKNEDGNPIAGATVSSWGPSTSSAQTAADGTYTMGNLSPGSYHVKVVAVGYATEYYNNVYQEYYATLVAVTDLLETPNIDFTLGLGGSISGVVKNESGNPIAGAAVSAHGPSYGDARTGADGSYAIVGLAQGNHHVRAAARSLGYPMEWYDGVYDLAEATLVAVTPPNNTPNIDFTLGLGGSISGVVKNESGNPIAGAGVTANSGDNYDSHGRCRTGADGSYTIAGLAPLSHSVCVDAVGYAFEYYDNVYKKAEATLVVVTPPNNTPNIDFTLGVGGSISGVVKNESGNPIAGAYVYPNEISWAYGFTAADGTYTIERLPSGSYTLGVDAVGYATEYYNNVYQEYYATLVAVTPPNDTPNIDFTLDVPDTTPPTTPVVTDDGIATTSTSQLHATWKSSDPESGVAGYRYAIGSTHGGTDVLDWASVGENIEITKEGLALIPGLTYYFSVKAVNGVGLESLVGVSDGITIADAGDGSGGGTPSWVWILVGVAGVLLVVVAAMSAYMIGKRRPAKS